MNDSSKEINRRHRIELRVTAEQDTLIRRAAALEHESITTFVLGTVTERAREVLEISSVITLENEAFDLFYATLDEPAIVVPELARLFQDEPFERG